MAAHTRLPSVGLWSWSRFLAVSLQVTWVINPAVGCHYFLPGPQLPSQPLRGLLPVLLLGEQRHDGCEQFDCYPTASWLRFEPGPFCTWVQHTNHSATEPPSRGQCQLLLRRNTRQVFWCHYDVLCSVCDVLFAGQTACVSWVCLPRTQTRWTGWSSSTCRSRRRAASLRRPATAVVAVRRSSTTTTTVLRSWSGPCSSWECRTTRDRSGRRSAASGATTRWRFRGCARTPWRRSSFLERASWRAVARRCVTVAAWTVTTTTAVAASRAAVRPLTTPSLLSPRKRRLRRCSAFWVAFWHAPRSNKKWPTSFKKSSVMCHVCSAGWLRV